MEPKKNPRYDLSSYRHLFFNGAMVVSLSTILVAFEWKSPIDPVVDDLDSDIISCEFDFYIRENMEREYEPPSTTWNEDGTVSISTGWDCSIPTSYNNWGFDDELPFLLVAEEMPEFKGGQEKLKAFLQNHLEYPQKAQRLGLEVESSSVSL